jgi:WD40 repeat protein
MRWGRSSAAAAAIFLGLSGRDAPATAPHPDPPGRGAGRAGAGEPIVLEGEAPSDLAPVVAFDHSGQALASGTPAGTVKMWDAVTGRKLRELPAGAERALRAIAFSPDGRRLAAGGAASGGIEHFKIYSGLGGAIILWDVATGRELRAIGKLPSPVMALSFAGDGSRLCSLDWGGSVAEWEVPDGGRLSLIGGRPLPVSSLRFDSIEAGFSIARDARRLVAIDSDFQKRAGKEINVWDLATARSFSLAAPAGRLESAALPPGGPRAGRATGRIRSVALSPDGTRVAAGYEIPESGLVPVLTLWDFESRAVLREFESGMDNGPAVIAFSPDGKWIVAGGENGYLEAWDVARGGRVLAHQGPRVPIRAVTFPYGRTLRVASGGSWPPGSEPPAIFNRFGPKADNRDGPRVDRPRRYGEDGPAPARKLDRPPIALRLWEIDLPKPPE